MRTIDALPMLQAVYRGVFPRISTTSNFYTIQYEFGVELVSTKHNMNNEKTHPEIFNVELRKELNNFESIGKYRNVKGSLTQRVTGCCITAATVK